MAVESRVVGFAPIVFLSPASERDEQHVFTPLGLADFAPRVAIAWGVGGGAGKTTKTVVRAGFGVFYDRLADTISLATLRYNGITQQSYLIPNPDFFPTIPTQLTRQPQQLQLLDGTFRAPRISRRIASRVIPCGVWAPTAW